MRVIAGVFTEEVGAVWWFTVRPVKSEGSVHFISRYMIETFAIKIIPAQACGLKKGECTHYIGLGKCEGILYGTIHMGFGRKVYDAVDLFVLQELADGFEVADVQFYELVVRFILDILKIGKVTGVSKFIDIYDAIVRVLVYQQPYYVATYEAGSAGYEDGSVHYNKLRRYWPY